MSHDDKNFVDYAKIKFTTHERRRIAYIARRRNAY